MTNAVPVRSVAVLVVTLLSSSLVVFGRDANADWDRLMDEGNAAMASHQYMVAETAYRGALDVAEKNWKKDARISGSLIRLAEACSDEQKKEEANLLAKRSLTTMDETLKAHKPKNASDELEQAEDSATLFEKAGDVFAANQDYADAELAYKKLISTREKYASEKWPVKPNNEDYFRFLSQKLSHARSKLADADEKLGNFYRSQHRFQQATDLYKTSTAIREKESGPESPQLAMSLSTLATCYAQQGQYELAEPQFKRVIGILEHLGYNDKPDLATALENYGLVLSKMDRQSEAHDVIERAHAIRTKTPR